MVLITCCLSVSKPACERGALVCTSNVSTREVEAGGLQGHSQPRPHSETLSRTKLDRADA